MGREGEGVGVERDDRRSEAADLRANIAGMLNHRRMVDEAIRGLRRDLSELAKRHPELWLGPETDA